MLCKEFIHHQTEDIIAAEAFRNTRSRMIHIRDLKGGQDPQMRSDQKHEKTDASVQRVKAKYR